MTTKTIDVAIDGAFGLLTSTISFLNPSLGIVAMAASPALAEQVKIWLKKWVNQGKITQRECSRMMSGVDGIMDTLIYYKEHEKIREDSLLQPNEDGFCDADDIFEFVLNHIKQDSERKKSYFCGIFIGSIPYAIDLDYDNLIQYGRIVSQLSYRELCILRNLHVAFKDMGVSFAEAEKYVKVKEDTKASELLSDILHLRNLGLVNTLAPYNVGDNIGVVAISFSGIRLFKLMRLNILDSDDVNKSLGDMLRITKYL